MGGWYTCCGGWVSSRSSLRSRIDLGEWFVKGGGWVCLGVYSFFRTKVGSTTHAFLTSNAFVDRLLVVIDTCFTKGGTLLSNLVTDSSLGPDSSDAKNGVNLSRVQLLFSAVLDK